MSNRRILPSYIVPTQDIILENLVIRPAAPVTVNDDWQREHWSGSITVEEDGHNGLLDNWVYLHALLADSRLPLYMLHAKGEEPSSFQIEEFDNKGNPHIIPSVIQFDPSDVLPAVYLDYENCPTVSYKELYEKYLAQNDVYLSAVKNYFVAQDINHHKRLCYIDTSYWQIVMLISSLEALLPAPVFCKGKCEKCGKGVNHVLNDPAKAWKELLFEKFLIKKLEQSIVVYSMKLVGKYVTTQSIMD